GAVEVLVLDLFLVEPFADDREHLGELAEDQRPVTFGDELVDHLLKQVELRGRQLVVFDGKLEEARMAANLTQLDERREDRELALRDSLLLDLLEELALGQLQNLAIERPLFGHQLAVNERLDLLGKILGDLLFHAAQDERIDPSAEPALGLAIT